MKLPILALLWCAGLLLAGSDSQWMPWVNGLGLLLFLVTSICIGKAEDTRRRRAYIRYD